MALQTMPAREILKLTRENHPENTPEPAPKGPAIGLAGMIGIAAFCGLAGLVFGAAALSTAFMADTAAEVLSVAPLIAMACSLLGGWMGAFFWMCQEESAHVERK